MVSIKEIPQILEDELPEIIKEIARQYSIKEYIENSDFLETRLKKWHQFGLLSHSKRVRKVFLKEWEDFLKKQEYSSKIIKKLSKNVDGISKKDLLEISIPLHDLGKIMVLGNQSFNREHEIHSEKLLYKKFLYGKLKSFGLSDPHLEYISKYVRNHDVVGKDIRDELKKEERLNLESISKKEVVKKCKKVYLKYPEIKTELGIYYFCDSFGKTDILINAQTDKDISKQERDIEKILKEKNLPQNLKYAVMQLPINIKLAKTYLENI